MRKTVEIIVCEVRGVLAAHFTSGQLQCSTDSAGVCAQIEMWFPVDRNNLFKSVEDFMVLNGLAVNLTSLSKVRECGNSIDYEAVYNAR